jgi:hypothetical protein
MPLKNRLSPYAFARQIALGYTYHCEHIAQLLINSNQPFVERRGRGKYAIVDQDAAKDWLNRWAEKKGRTHEPIRE